jgi:hypothetical protein
MEIIVELKSKEDYLNPYNKDKINSALSAYILDECKAIKSKDKIKIEVRSSFVMNEDEKENFVHLIRANFGIDIKEILFLEKRFMVFNLIVLLIGFSLIYVENIFLNVPIFAEVIGVAGTLLIWETIYNLSFHRISNYIAISRLKRLCNSKINFV